MRVPIRSSLSCRRRAPGGSRSEPGPGPGSSPTPERGDRACPNRPPARSVLRASRRQCSCTRRGQFGTESAGEGGFVHDHATSGSGDRCEDGVEVQGDQRSQIEQVGADPVFVDDAGGDVDHGAVGEHGHIVAGAPQDRRAQRHGVVAVGARRRVRVRTTARPVGRDGRRRVRCRAVSVRGRSPDRCSRSRRSADPWRRSGWTGPP